MDTPRPIHERLQDHVRAAGLSYVAIAKKTGWSEQRVSRLLRGLTELTASDMEVFAELLGKTVASLFRDRGAKAS